MDGKPEAGYSLQQDCLEVPCVQQVLVISPDKPGWPKRHVTITHVATGVAKYQIHTSNMVPSMGLIVPDVTSHGRQNQL